MTVASRTGQLFPEPIAGASGNSATLAANVTANVLVVGASNTSIQSLGATGNATTVLHGSANGLPTFGSVVEGDLSLSNVTTWNASNTAHGFAPQLNGNASTFYNGAGGYSVPAGTALQPWSKPTSPSTYDDEFEATSLNGSWTVLTNTGSSQKFNDNSAQGCMAVVVNAGNVSNKYVIDKSFTPGSNNYSVTMRAWYSGIQSNFQTCRFYVGDVSGDSPGTGNQIQVGFGWNVGLKLELHKFVSGSETTISDITWSTGTNFSSGVEVWLHLQRVSGTYRAMYSVNGAAWMDFTVSGLPAITPTHLGILAAAYASTSLPFDASIDFIRTNWIFYT